MYEKTYEQIKADILSRITLTDKREGSFVQDMISPVSLELEKVYAQFDRILDMAFITELSGEYLDKRAAEYGIYRKGASKANGYMTMVGTEDNFPSAPSLSIAFVTPTGLRFFRPVASSTTLVIDGVKCRRAAITAEKVGDEYNLPINTELVPDRSIQYLSNTYISTATTGGADSEPDEQLRARLLEHLRKPATSGNANEYRQWALEVDGVGDAKIFGGKKGSYSQSTHQWQAETGSVNIMVVDVNKERFSTTEIPNKVTAYIENLRPIGAKIYVSRGVAVTLSVAATVTIDTSTTLAEVQDKFSAMYTEFVRDSVFKRSVIDYNKVLSMFYDIEGVVSATCTLNDGTSNIAIYEYNVPTTGTITITEAT